MKFVVGILKGLTSSSSRSDEAVSVEFPTTRVASDETPPPPETARQAAPILIDMPIFEAETPAESFYVENLQVSAVGHRVTVHAISKPADEVEWDFEPLEGDKPEPQLQSEPTPLPAAVVQPDAAPRLLPHQRSLSRLRRYNERERRFVSAAAIEALRVHGSLSEKDLALFKSALHAASTQETLKDDVILLTSYYSDILLATDEGLRGQTRLF